MASRSLDELNPGFRVRVDAWLKACDGAGLVILPTCTYRNALEQEALYAIGRTVKGEGASWWKPMGDIVTRARPFQSAHQYRMAIDFVPLNCGKPDWSGNSALWDSAIDLAEANNLESLRPMESAHVQLPNWRDFAGAPAP